MTARQIAMQYARTNIAEVQKGTIVRGSRIYKEIRQRDSETGIFTIYIIMTAGSVTPIKPEN
jgi:hypothetical protein